MIGFNAMRVSSLTDSIDGPERDSFFLPNVFANVFGFPAQPGVRAKGRLHLLVSRQPLGCNLTMAVEQGQKRHLVRLQRKQAGEQAVALLYKAFTPRPYGGTIWRQVGTEHGQ